MTSPAPFAARQPSPSLGKLRIRASVQIGTACPVHSSGAQASCLHPRAHISARSNPAAPATPENRPRYASKKDLPRALEFAPGFGEVLGCAARAFPGAAAGIEAAIPAPRVLVVRVAGPDRDHPDVHVTEIDVPALLGDICVAAAGEGEHGPIKARAGPVNNRPS